MKPTGVLSEKHWNNIHTAVATLHPNTATAHINNDDIWQVLMNGLNNQPLEWSSNNDVQALLQEPVGKYVLKYMNRFVCSYILVFTVSYVVYNLLL